MPLKLLYAAAIESEDSFITLGGHNGHLMINEIYRYDKDGDKWEKVPAVLSQAKYFATAISVKSTIFKLC